MNFRDVGGYLGVDGRTTAWGVVYRSDTLYNLTDDDVAAVKALGIASVLDLRRADECAREPGRLACTEIALPSRTVFDTDPATLVDRSDGERWLAEDYEGMLANGAKVFGELFRRLADPSTLPAVIHCTGGKDRTGMAIALLLSAVGVDRETVLDDYELTNRFRSSSHVPAVVDLFVTHGISRPAAEAMLDASRSAMAQALDKLDADYGGIDHYLTGPACLSRSTIDGLRTVLLDT